MVGLSLFYMGTVQGTHWAGTASLGPTQVYQDEWATFTFTLQNAASGSLDVYWIFSHFCWLPSNQGYYFKANDGTPVSVPGGGSRAFSIAIRVSQTYSGSCTVATDVSGQAVGDFLQETVRWNHVISVIIPPALTVVATANPSSGSTPLTVTLSAQVSGAVYGSSITWDFGDGNSGSGPSVTHSYSYDGTFTATATATDGLGRSSGDSKSVTVYQPLGAQAAATPSSPVIGAAVAFMCSVSGGIQPYSVSWAFGDGSYGTGKTASHAYATAGTKTATCNVTDGSGASATSWVSLQVLGGSGGGGGNGGAPGAVSESGLFLIPIGILAAVVIGVFVLLRVRKKGSLRQRRSRAAGTRSRSGPLSEKTKTASFTRFCPECGARSNAEFCSLDGTETKSQET